MATLLAKLEIQGWTNMFLQVNFQRNFGRPGVTEFYANGVENGSFFSTSVSIYLVAEDISRILNIPVGGWDHYLNGPYWIIWRLLLLSLENSLVSLIFLCIGVYLNEKCPPTQHLVWCGSQDDHPSQGENNWLNYLDLTLIEHLDTEVNINFPNLMIKHLQRLLLKDKKGSALPYGFWFSMIFEDYTIHVQVWMFETTKDVLG